MLRVFAVVGLALTACLAFAQAAPRLQFEVASIRRNKTGELPLIRALASGRMTLTNLPMQLIFMTAYHVKDVQISGAPAWFASERYDVDAKAESHVPFDGMRPMLQSLLEDRMRIKFHRETKQLPIFSLTLVNSAKLRGAEGNCGPSDSPTDPAKLLDGPCGYLFVLPGHLLGQKATMRQLTDALSLEVDRLVLDKTNLSARYDIKLQYTPEGPIPSSPRNAPPGMPPLPPIDPNGPSLFTALQEQLGLKLESQKGPVDIMVIDHVERPSDN